MSSVLRCHYLLSYPIRNRGCQERVRLTILAPYVHTRRMCAQLF